MENNTMKESTTNETGVTIKKGQGSRLLLPTKDGRKVGVHEALDDKTANLMDEANDFMEERGHLIRPPTANISVDEFEIFFVKIFLYPDEDFEDKDVIIEQFIKFTNGHRYGVNIMEGDEKVAYIPPLVNTSLLNIGAGRTLKNLMDQVTLERRNNPAQGDNTLDHGLVEFTNNVIDTSQVDHSEANIFKKWLFDNYEPDDNRNEKEGVGSVDDVEFNHKLRDDIFE
jgi:hypothetical protein